MLKAAELFLEWNDNEGQYQVQDADGHSLAGGSYEPTDAIKHARTITTAPIKFSEFEDIENVCVSEKPDGAIADSEVFISALAEIAGMKVKKCYDDNMNFIGYTMELIE